MNITMQTRSESYKSVMPNAKRRRDAILEILKDGDMTAVEVAEFLYAHGQIPFYERNFAAPRLTELKNEGKVKTVGKRYCQKTDRRVAVWALA